MAKEDPVVIPATAAVDRFFSAIQQQKLMAEWRTRRDQGKSLPPQTQQELETLVEAELLASAALTSAILDDLTP